MANFVRHRLNDTDLTRIQDQIESYATELRSEMFPPGRLIKNVKLSTTKHRVFHGLNRNYSGYVIVFKDAHATVKVDKSDNVAPLRYIPLVASADVEVSLWVF